MDKDKIVNKKNTLKQFIIKCFETLHPCGEYYDNWHIDLIVEYLQSLERGDMKKLLINMPPRSLKSLCISVAWPAWLLGHNPGKKIIVASCNQRLANKFSLDTRYIMQSDWYKEIFAETRIARGQNTKQKFATTAHGCRIATSVRSSIIGEGGDILIIDDPHTPSNAFSKKEMQRVGSWYDQEFATRLNDPKNGRTIVVMQRLHCNDLSAYLLKKSTFTHLAIPMLTQRTENIEFGDFKYKRLPNEPLNQHLYDLAAVKELRKEIGEHIFSAQYQQQPIAQDGQLFKYEWLQYYTNLPQEDYLLYQSWDCASKAGISNDYSVCTTWAVNSNDEFYILEVTKMKLQYPQLRHKVRELYDRYKPIAVLIEDAASGQQLIQEYRDEINIIPITVHKDKVNRFLGILPVFETGKVYIHKLRYWRAELEYELTNFPDVSYNDQVDSVSQFLSWYMKQRQTCLLNIRIL